MVNSKELLEAVEMSDFKTARGIFAQYIRRTLNPDLFSSIAYFVGDNAFMLPDESIEAAAERILDNKLVSVGVLYDFHEEVDWSINPTYNEYREWTWQLSRHHEFKLLAYRYLQTKDERFAKSFVELFESWVKQAVVPQNARGHETLCWRTIEAGIRASMNWPYALHAFYQSPYFTDDVLIDWYKSVWEHGWRLRNFHMTGNWLIMEMDGLANIGILFPMFNDSDEWLQYSYDKLSKELSRQIYPDGFQFELTTNYQHVVISHYSYIIKVANLYGISSFDHLKPTLEKVNDLYLKIVMPNGRLPDLNDGCNERVSKLIESAVEMFPNRKDFLWAKSQGKEGLPPEYKSVLLTYSGIAVMRTSWDSDAVWALFDGGPYGAGHQHEDKTNLLIFAYGKMLLTECGSYAYDDSEMRKYAISSRSHNVILVDGQEQNRRFNYGWKEDDISKLSDIKWLSTDDVDVSEGYYDEGFGTDCAIQVKHIRKVIFVKKHTSLDAYFIVVDRLYPQDVKSHSYNVLWHFDSESVKQNGLSVISGEDDGPCITIKTPKLKDATLKIVCGCKDIGEWQGWKNLNKDVQDQYLPAPTAIYNYTSKEPIRIVTLLYPSKDKYCKVVDIEASAKVYESQIKLFLDNGGIIELDELDYLL